MIRRIIKIDKEKCNGCGICADACHEGAIAMIDGKAELTREDYCDGLGDCLPGCPTGAITFEEREAPAYNEAAVLAAKAAKEKEKSEEKICSSKQTLPTGCPGMQAKSLQNRANENGKTADTQTASLAGYKQPSHLAQWPVQIKLMPLTAPYYDNANLLIAADCSAFTYGNFHQDFMRNKVTIIGCPKLDAIDYSEKLTQIIAQNNIKSVTIVRMEVPCCGGLENAVKKALMASGKFIPWNVVTISIDGRILD